MKERWRRLLWFAGIWAAGVVTLGLFAYALRWLIGPLIGP